jgi:hypothetical protein
MRRQPITIYNLPITRRPSPFVTQTANKVFRSVDEAFEYFDQKGYFQPITPSELDHSYPPLRIGGPIKG